MPRLFKLKSSRFERNAVLLILAIASLISIFYVQEPLVQGIFLLATCLLVIAEVRQFRRGKALYLYIDSDRCGLCHGSSEQPYFSVKNKVYQSRWFAILKLCYRHNSNTIMLLPDRFDSIHEYQNCRYLLRELDKL